MIGAFRVVQRNALVYRRAWRGSLFFSFLQPTLFLLAMGLGLGSLVDRGNTSLLQGVAFLHFLAPGILAGASMQTASFECSFPITGKMTWNRNYEAITATPMGITDLVLGELAWVAVRLTLIATAFTLVMWLYGIPRSATAVLSIPAAVLTGLAFSGPIMAFAATRKNGGAFNGMFRFVITPLYLFSGTFFPIARLPEPLQKIAWLTPLFHGVELVRGFTLGNPAAPGWVIHAGYLLLMTVAGALAAMWTFRRKLRT